MTFYDLCTFYFLDLAEISLESIYVIVHAATKLTLGLIDNCSLGAFKFIFHPIS